MGALATRSSCSINFFFPFGVGNGLCKILLAESGLLSVRANSAHCATFYSAVNKFEDWNGIASQLIDSESKDSLQIILSSRNLGGVYPAFHHGLASNYVLLPGRLSFLDDETENPTIDGESLVRNINLHFLFFSLLPPPGLPQYESFFFPYFLRLIYCRGHPHLPALHPNLE